MESTVIGFADVNCAAEPTIASWYHARDLIEKHGDHTCFPNLIATAYLSAAEDGS